MKDVDIVSLLSASTKLDLHGMTRDEAKCELIRLLDLVDVNVKAIEVVHGYHNGRALRSLVRDEIDQKLVSQKVKIDPSRTLFVLNFNNIGHKNNKI